MLNLQIRAHTDILLEKFLKKNIFSLAFSILMQSAANLLIIKHFVWLYFLGIKKTVNILQGPIHPISVLHKSYKNSQDFPFVFVFGYGDTFLSFELSWDYNLSSGKNFKL